MTYFTYRRSAATTTAVTVVSSARAFATAATHRSVGIRSERGMVAMSGRLRATSGDPLGDLGLDSATEGLPRLHVGVPADWSATVTQVQVGLR